VTAAFIGGKVMMLWIWQASSGTLLVHPSMYRNTLLLLM
jgi:hypothetical protein